MERLQSTVRESLMANSRVLSDISAVVKQLKVFADTVEPLQEFSRTVVRSAVELDKTLLQAKDIRAVLKEANTAIETLNRPGDVALFLAQVDKAKNLLTYFQQHREIDEAPLLIAQLTQALGKTDEQCCSLLAQNIDSYNKQYGSGELNHAKVKWLKPVRTLMSYCRKNQPSRYLQSYSGVRGQFLQANVVEASKSGSLMMTLNKFIECCALESQLEGALFRKFDSLNILNSTVTPCFQAFEQAVKNATGERADISSVIEFCAAFEEALEYLKSIAGESEVLVTSQSLLKTAIRKIDGWLQSLYGQATQGLVSELPSDPLVKVIKELLSLKDYARLLNNWGLHKSVHEVLQRILSNLKAQAKSAKSVTQAHLFQLNSLWILLQRLRVLDALLPEEFDYSIGEELKTQTEEFFRHAYAPLEPVLSNIPNIIEFKKPGVLNRWSRNAVKKKYKAFNATMQKTLASLQSLLICDAVLADRLRQMAVQRLIPQFESFVKTYTAVEFTRRLGKYTVYSNDSIRSTLMQSFVIRPV
mmetsp:Transcript_25642/g.44869  ORF Transcript_25642/g.44869 Transcript_25642/m.44869 type:complete len:530 (-) Transcript_25642:650-2239(-)